MAPQITTFDQVGNIDHVGVLPRPLIAMPGFFGQDDWTDCVAALAAFGDPANDLARGYEAWLDFHNQEQPDFPISWLDLGE